MSPAQLSRIRNTGVDAQLLKQARSRGPAGLAPAWWGGAPARACSEHVALPLPPVPATDRAAHLHATTTTTL